MKKGDKRVVERKKSNERIMCTTAKAYRSYLFMKFVDLLNILM